MKFHENMSSTSRVVPCGTAVEVCFCTFANVLERRVQYNLSWITMRRRTGVISNSLREQLQNTAVLFSCHYVRCYVSTTLFVVRDIRGDFLFKEGLADACFVEGEEMYSEVAVCHRGT
jgi:hypothetical protein